jgi:hypothetical protein
MIFQILNTIEIIALNVPIAHATPTMSSFAVIEFPPIIILNCGAPATREYFSGINSSLRVLNFSMN